MQVDTLKKGKRKGKGKNQHQRGNRRPTRALQTSTIARIAANLDIERKTAGIPEEERMTIPLTEILAKAAVKKHR